MGFEISSREDLAWAAGYFDGEGSSFLKKNGKFNNKNLAISIAQNDPETLKKFFGIVQKGKLYEYRVWQWKTTNFADSQFVIGLLWPWLGSIKKQQYSDACKKYLESRKITQVHRKVRVCGTWSKYSKGCRCDKCREAQHEAYRHYKLYGTYT